MGIDEQTGIKYEGRSGDRWASRAALTLAVSTWLAILFNNPISFGWFAFHPTLQTLALTCFTYGVLTLQPTSQPKSKAAGFRRHQTAILYIGVPTITLGTLAVWYNKWLRDAAHFKTWHGTFGLICMLWLLAQIFVGAGSVWNGGALFGGGMKAKALWKYHRMSGYILFPLMLFTAHLGGGWSNWGENNTNSFVRFVAYTLAPALILTGIYARVR
ncbi:hypothetical protein P691DRAFT_793915 [Macrolepiota fuliginosa MF-IS2]|uniref:Cytochrome b561 domain-containing protein n=1 Tax=Macrolepiota fuliginosa MF-IS2 TaxID=1400762 RepID=A0A9P6C5F3_9AGAR|nr:hypothetical protein P691DRAFT_793915 [Macrolepiota fuliginosa MF-IS2]